MQTIVQEAGNGVQSPAKKLRSNLRPGADAATPTRMQVRTFLQATCAHLVSDLAQERV